MSHLPVAAVLVPLSAAFGSYLGMPEARSFGVSIHCPTAPAQVLVGDSALRGGVDWHFGAGQVVLGLTCAEDPARQQSVVIRGVWP